MSCKFNLSSLKYILEIDKRLTQIFFYFERAPRVAKHQSKHSGRAATGLPPLRYATGPLGFTSRLSHPSRKTPVAFLLFIIVVAACSCADGSKSGKQIFHYNEYTGIASLDPAFAKNQSTMWPAHQLFNTLVEIDDSLNIKPSLATHWDISEDKRTYTFYLRKDVLFHDDACFPQNKGRRQLLPMLHSALAALPTPKQPAPAPGFLTVK
ncbi:ABC transporter substrate-binding protein [Niabella ginsengisoli]|uniref:ABC transporter substrate-binding protein n=1 Tax=Niabella ginsengisoli TaxID=522298 RepID=UPI0021D47B5E|nr:ABC transporter substrate-binding protein [Niabella ginsengisoli]